MTSHQSPQLQMQCFKDTAHHTRLLKAGLYSKNELGYLFIYTRHPCILDEKRQFAQILRFADFAGRKEHQIQRKTGQYLPGYQGCAPDEASPRVSACGNAAGAVL